VCSKLVLLVGEVSSNGEQCLNWLSQLRGQAHTYRVIAVDQIGFSKSTKPQVYQYTFQQLARNTHALLESLSIQRAILVAYPTGGVIAIRYALMYPASTNQLALVDPIG
jgi:pimeloyl-ACP methyl ester carboxylesterase